MQFNPLTSNLNFQHHYSSRMCCHAAQETFIIIINIKNIFFQDSFMKFLIEQHLLNIYCHF